MTISLAIGLIFFILLIEIYVEVRFPKVHRLPLYTKKIPHKKKFSILQLSDIHNKSFGKENVHLFTKIEHLQPDIIVITGDLIDGGAKDFKAALQLIEQLQFFNKPIYFVTGNHEWRYKEREAFLFHLEKKGLILLRNTMKTLQMDNFFLQLCGVEDAHTHHENISSTLQDRKEAPYTILLSHTPGIIKSKGTFLVDLILSGHTHGGQIRIPFFGALIAPGQGFFPPYNKGLYRIGKNTLLYIDSGLGTSRLPIRLFNRSQVTYITIQGNGKT